MTDQNQHEVVLGLGLTGDALQRIGQLLAGRLRTAESVHMARRTRRLEDAIEIAGGAREALLVVRLAPEPGHGEKVDIRTRRCVHEERECQAQSRRCPHTTPHFRRSSHSLLRSASSSRNTMGMFHSSRVWRSVMPA